MKRMENGFPPTNIVIIFRNYILRARKQIKALLQGLVLVPSNGWGEVDGRGC